MKVVIDASAAAKWFLREEGSEDMRAVRGLILEGALTALAPDLMLAELANVLRFAKGVGSEDVANAVRATLAIGVEVRSFADLVEAAARIAFEKGLTMYDAAYAALAEGEGARLVTYDRELLGKLEYAATAGDLLRSLQAR